MGALESMIPYLASPEKPEIWYHLLRILFYEDDLVQIVDPDKTQDDYFGIPDSARGSSVERWTFRHSRRDPARDFTAWYGEKASRVKTGALLLIRDWRLFDACTYWSEWYVYRDLCVVTVRRERSDGSSVSHWLAFRGDNLVGRIDA